MFKRKRPTVSAYIAEWINDKHVFEDEGIITFSAENIIPFWPAERFLSVVGAIYIYSGSNNKQESAQNNLFFYKTMCYYEQKQKRTLPDVISLSRLHAALQAAVTLQVNFQDLAPCTAAVKSCSAHEK